VLNRLLYTSLVDVSVPYGPGVNERGFIKDMSRRFGDNFKAVIPRPSKGLPDDLRHADIAYLNYSRSSRTPFGWMEARLIGCFSLRKIVKEFQPEFIVTRLGAFSLPQFIATYRNSIPFALKTAGGGNYVAFYNANPVRRVFSGINEYIFANQLKKCVTVDVVSDIQLKSLTERYPWISERAFMIDNGVDLEMFSSEEDCNIRDQLGFEENNLVLGYVGAFPMSRGGREVIDMVKSLQDLLPVKGLIVGDSGEAGQCRQYACDKRVEEHIVITGQVEYERVPCFMKAMDIGFSILSPDKQHASEQKVRQYLASGLSVVGTPGSNDFLKGYDFARIVSGKSISEIAEAVFSFLAEGREGLMKRGKEARKFAENELSIESRNTYRLKLWKNVLVEAGENEGTQF
jgi:glycosyltransferase involved in cell wall biosynthesis